MKKALRVFGSIVLALLIAGGGFAAYMAYSGSRLDASSKAYVDGQLPAIVSGWSENELYKRAAPELRRLVTDRQLLDRVFAEYSRFGRLERYGGSKGEAHILFTPARGEVVTAAYVAQADFENGPAQITVRLVRRSGQWQLLYFNVSSPTLTKGRK